MLPIEEKIMFLREVPMFQNMSADQLLVVAGVCDEATFAEDAVILREGIPGGELHVIINGRIAIEQQRSRGETAHLATLETADCLGEMSLFDQNPHSASAIALEETFTLRLTREAVVKLLHQYPDLALTLIVMLSRRLREANERIAAFTRSKPTVLQKFYDTI